METRDNFDEEMSEVLVDGILKFEFLRVKASSPITLQCSNSEINSTGRNFCTNSNLTSLALIIIFFFSSGSAVFVLYNYSRLNAIIHEFENRVQKKYYPPLPSLEHVDLGVLKEEVIRHS